MGTTLSKVSIQGLRRTHFEQLLSYINSAEDSLDYYGNRDQFQKRHKEIKDWVSGILGQSNKK